MQCDDFYTTEIYFGNKKYSIKERAYYYDDLNMCYMAHATDDLGNHYEICWEEERVGEFDWNNPISICRR